MLPPCVSTIARQMKSPIPIPLDFVVKKGSKIRSSFAPSIPVPVSSMATKTAEDSRTTSERYPQQARTIGDGVHRFDCIHDQIHKNLFQLRSIGKHLRQSLIAVLSRQILGESANRR